MLIESSVISENKKHTEVNQRRLFTNLNARLERNATRNEKLPSLRTKLELQLPKLTHTGKSFVELKPRAPLMTVTNKQQNFSPIKECKSKSPPKFLQKKNIAQNSKSWIQLYHDKSHPDRNFYYRNTKPNDNSDISLIMN